MKKMGCVFALFLCLSLTAGALAATTVAVVGEYEDVRWIDGTNLLSVSGKDGYAVADIEGNRLTEELYGRSFDYSHGYIQAYKANVEEINIIGVLNLEGKEVVPLQYGHIKIMNEHWIMGYVLQPATADKYDFSSWFSDQVYLIDQAHIYHMPEGICVASFSRDEFEEAQALGQSINVKNRTSGTVTAYDQAFNVLGTDLRYVSEDTYALTDVSIFRRDGRVGLKDMDGNEILEPTYQSIYSFYGDYAVVSRDAGEGLINKAGIEILPTQYEDIKRNYSAAGDGYQNAGYYGVVVNGKLGFVREGGTVTCQPTLSSEVLNFNGASASYEDLNGDQHILAADGVDTIIEGYERVSVANDSQGLYYIVRDADYNMGLIDWHGKEVFPCENGDISFSGDGCYALVEPRRGNQCLIYTVVFEDEYGAGVQQGAEVTDDATDSAKKLLESAATLFAQDAAGMKDSAVLLLKQSKEALKDNVGVAAVLDSAIVLAELDAPGNAEAILSLLEAAKGML